MPTLSGQELAELRRDVASESATVPWDKAAINAALQALEDWYEAERTQVNALIDTAAAPFVFTNPQKKVLAKHFLRQKFRREGE